MYEEYLEKLKTECLLRNRSAKTARTYINCVLSVMKWTGYKPMEELTVEDCREFILQKRQSGTATAACNLYNATLVFLFKWVLKKPWDPERVPRMKVDHKLPEVLTLEEVEALIDTAKTIRNKALISLMYSSGLRVGELISLRADDIYMSTMQVHIRESKNHCDHYQMLKLLQYHITNMIIRLSYLKPIFLYQRFIILKMNYTKRYIDCTMMLTENGIITSSMKHR